MQTDLLPAFLHLYHAFGPYSAALLRLLGHFDDDPGRVLESEPQELRELGYSARPATEAVRDAVAWFRANGYC